MKRFWLLGFGFLFSLTSYALELRVDSVVSAKQLIEHEIKEHGADKVLVVFDVDHTLLSPYSDLGSSYWYSWQSSLIKTIEQEPEQLAKDTAEFDSVNEKVMKAVRFHPVEAQTKDVWNTLLQGMTNVMVLTARSITHREVTVREFKANGLALPSKYPGKNVEGGWVFGVDKHGGALSKADLEKFSYTSPKPMTYQNGILMVTGQNKGLALKSLLRKFGEESKYKSIILFDDGGFNCKAFQDVFGTDREIDLTTLQYTFDYPKFDRFGASEKFSATEEYKRISMP